MTQSPTPKTPPPPPRKGGGNQNLLHPIQLNPVLHCCMQAKKSKDIIRLTAKTAKPFEKAPNPIYKSFIKYMWKQCINFYGKHRNYCCRGVLPT